MSTKPKALSVTPPHLAELSQALPITLSLREAAQVLQISVRTLQRHIASGELRVIKPPERNARVIVTRSELVRWLAERSQ